MKEDLEAIYIFGAGNVGLGVALALDAGGLAPVGLCCRGEQRAEQVRSCLGIEPDLGEPGEALRVARLVLVCVADGAIGDVGRQLGACADRGLLGEGVVVAHTSGCHGSGALGTIPGARLASLHPLVACPSPERAAVALRGAFYAAEGDEAALPQLQRLVARLDGRCAVLPAAVKARYHAAAVLASNLVVALMAEAFAVAGDLGLVDPSDGDDSGGLRHALLDLAVGALEQVRVLGVVGGLTGPIVRGDDRTVRRHLDSLRDTPRETYRLLSRRALRLAREGGLGAEHAEALARLLQ